MNTHRLAMIAVTTLLAACQSSGLGSGEWLWCKENPASVDAAATSLGIATAERTVQQPTWWGAYVATVASQNNTQLLASADFADSCTAAQVKASVDPANVSWCSTDGIGETWDAAMSLSLMTNVDATTFAYEALPLQQRLNDPDFDRACKAAYAAQ